MWQGHQASQGQVWKLPGIAPGSWFFLLPFSAPLSGEVPVARLSHGLTPWLDAQPVGHSGLELLVGADSGAQTRPAALMRFHHPACAPRRPPWDCCAEMQNCRGLSAFTKERPSSLNRGEPGGEEVRLRAPQFVQPQNQSHQPSPTFPRGRDKIKDREN